MSIPLDYSVLIITQTLDVSKNNHVTLVVLSNALVGPINWLEALLHRGKQLMKRINLKLLLHQITSFIVKVKKSKMITFLKELLTLISYLLYLDEKLMP